MHPQSLEIKEGSYKDALFNTELLNEHWNEIVTKKHLFKVNGDYERYSLLETDGALLTLIAKVNDVVVGYSVNIISPHLHYKDSLVCYNDLLFVSKEKRTSPLGIKLIKHTEELAKQRGAQVMLWHAKQDTPLSKILPRMGNTLHEHIYMKEL